MTALTEAEEKEYQDLMNRHGLVVLYPYSYRYREDDDTYNDKDDKHEWHSGADVRRLNELADRRAEANVNR